jgi:hypothetical protein
MQTPIYQLTPDASSRRMHYRADPSLKAYRIHVTYDLRANEWVAWATYGPATSPDRGQTEIGRSLNVRVAVEMANERARTKSDKGYGVPGSDGYWSGQIGPEIEADLIHKASRAV